MSESNPARVYPFGAVVFYLSLLAAVAAGQDNPYPHNAVSCERCHSSPNKFGSSGMTVQRIGFLIQGNFILVPEGGIHHRNGESAQSPASTKQLAGERVSLSLLGDGYIEAIDSRDIEQNAQRQHESNLSIAGVVVSTPVIEARGISVRPGK